MLKDGVSVTETSWAIGFEDPVYFSKVFKKYFGFPPSLVKNK
jgi:AraC-like DNA-binding protein